MSRKDFAIAVSEALSLAGQKVVLTGGSAVSIHSGEAYVSLDLDFIQVGFSNNQKLTKALQSVGFIREKGSKYFNHPLVEWSIEFPPGPLAVGNQYLESRDAMKLVSGNGELLVLSPTDCMKDRLL